MLNRTKAWIVKWICKKWLYLTGKDNRRSSNFTPMLAPLWVVASLWMFAGVIVFLAVNKIVRSSASLIGENPSQIEVTKVVLTLVAGVGIVLAGVYAYRKQRVEEGSSHRADAAAFADRYNSAVDQLGSNAASIRLAGAYAMARLADNWAEQQQVCVDVLCGYLRMTRPAADAMAEKSQDQEVRATIQTLIRAHLRASAGDKSWSKLNLNFDRAQLVNFNLGHAIFSGDSTSFTGATFSGERTSFNEATFCGKVTSFGGATFSGVNTSFAGTTFSGEHTTFAGSTFQGQETLFTRARFSGVGTSFASVTFSGKRARFNETTFSAKYTSFVGAICSGVSIVFGGVIFAGDSVSFAEARFKGQLLSFKDAAFLAPRTSFNLALFAVQELLLSLSAFHGVADFDNSVWEGPGKFELGFAPVPSQSAPSSVRMSWDGVHIVRGARVTVDGRQLSDSSENRQDSGDVE